MKTLSSPQPVIPNRLLSQNGLATFLASPYVKGVGKVYGEKLAKQYGMDILSPDFNFESLSGTISGLSGNKISELKNSLQELKINPRAAVLLFSAGLSNIEAGKILSHYGRKIVEALTEDPYDMVENAWKVSFFTADKLGKWMGIAPDDPRRLRGALLTAVKFYAEKGSLFATRGQAVATAAKLTGAPEEKVAEELENLIRDERLVSSHDGIYLPVYYHAEKEAAKKLASLIKKGAESIDIDVIPTTDIKGNLLNEDQQRALRTVMTHPVTIISGGPGTGKTTTIRGIIELFEGMDKKVILAAPTGRAAKRMADLAGAEAKTIHRLLGYSMGKGYRHKHFKGDILVIDEASMLEQVLFNHLLDALEGGTKVVLVGDTNQLPPIGAGDVLNDMIASGTVPVINLKENFRQKAGSTIASTAEAIKAGVRSLEKNAEDFLIINESNTQKIKQRLFSMVKTEIPDKYHIHPNQIQVVTPQNDGPLGAKELNPELQEIVNPAGPGLKHGRKTLRLGDRVMQTSNSSENDVYNGETGWISAVDELRQTLEVTFYDGKVRVYPKDRLKELNLAYAMTVHKLQGSETEYMILLLPIAHRQMLYRNLLYTGISRARKLCVVIGEGKAIDTALSTSIDGQRNSNFKQRLQKRLPYYPGV